MYRLRREIAEYDVLHAHEMNRLLTRRQTAVGPIENRVRRLEYQIQMFAVRWYLDWGDTGHRVPNGDITSRPVVYMIVKDDVAVAGSGWASLLPANTIVSRPWVDMKKLRGWLDAEVKAGRLQRMVSKPSADPGDVEFYLVDEAEGWRYEFGEGFVGVWFWTESATGEYDVEHGDILEGVTWEPNGTMGSGRNFKIKL